MKGGVSIFVILITMNVKLSLAKAMVDSTLLDLSGNPVESSHRKFFTRPRSQYVDKTLFIRDILLHTYNHPSNLIIRPRGFGKSLALSSVYYFCDYNFKNATELFSGLKVMGKTPDLDYLRKKYMGKFPVIWIDLRTVTYTTFEENMNEIKRIVSNIYRGHKYLLESDKLNSRDRAHFQTFLRGEAKEHDFEHSIGYLTKWVCDHLENKTKPIILVDNYDVPFHTGYRYNCFWEIAEFMGQFYFWFMHERTSADRVILAGESKTLELSQKQSIFDQALFIHPRTVFDKFTYSDHFGFTNTEVEGLLQRSESKIPFRTLKERYGGYLFENASLFNPASVVKEIFSDEPYQWTKTDSNELPERVIVDNGLYPLLTVQQLLAGEHAEKRLKTVIHLLRLNTDEEMYWSFLVYSGYLTAKITQDSTIEGYKKRIGLLRVPNLEVRKKIESVIKAYSAEEIPDYNYFIDYLKNGNCQKVKTFIETYIERSGEYYRIFYNNPVEDVRKYVAQMLQGLKSRYNMTLTNIEVPNGVKIQIESEKQEVQPISIAIQSVNSCVERSWKRVKNKFCSILKPLGKARAEILIILSENRVIDVCINYSIQRIS